ncbi:hypothetical protein D3C86_2030650 [compost metagenome]
MIALAAFADVETSSANSLFVLFVPLLTVFVLVNPLCVPASSFLVIPNAVARISEISRDMD